MKKYYRNRYSSFLQALAAKKQEDVKQSELIKEKEVKKIAKLKEKVLGTNQIQSKIFQVKQQEESSSDE